LICGFGRGGKAQKPERSSMLALVSYRFVIGDDSCANVLQIADIWQSGAAGNQRLVRKLGLRREGAIGLRHPIGIGVSQLRTEDRGFALGRILRGGRSCPAHCGRRRVRKLPVCGKLVHERVVRSGINTLDWSACSASGRHVDSDTDRNDGG
jgi:hypothetical protein